MYYLVLNQNSSGIQPADRKCTQPLLLSVLELDEKKPADSLSAFLPPCTLLCSCFDLRSNKPNSAKPWRNNLYSDEQSI